MLKGVPSVTPGGQAAYRVATVLDGRRRHLGAPSHKAAKEALLNRPQETERKHAKQENAKRRPGAACGSPAFECFFQNVNRIDAASIFSRLIDTL